MADYLDNYDDIVFLDSEIEPDDDSAPFGELITVVDGKVYRAQDIPAPAPVEEPVPAEPAAEEAPVAAETPAEEETPAPVLPDYAPVAAEEEPAPALPDYAPVEEPAPAHEEAAEEEKEELPEADPVLLYAYGVTPAAKEEPAPPVEEEAAVPAEPAAEGAPAEAETPAERPVEEAPAEEPVAETPAPKKAPAKKKPISHVIYQSGAEEKDLWGSVSIAPAKKKKEAPAEEASEKQEDAPAKAPAKKKNTKKAVETAAKEEKIEAVSSESVADATSDSDKPKEENKVAKEKAAPASAKKTAAKPAEKKAPEKKPAAKAATAKAAPAKKAAPAAKPAAKPATKAVKEETKPAEQVIEAGDDSAPHGRFVIKKTDKGNFVYKLYSSNYRVVAIGAGLYTSIANCKTGINSVRNNAASAPIEDQTLQKWEELKFPKWQIYTDKQGEIRLRLLASNGNIVATTNDGYLSKEAAKKGIAAIARAAKGASIVRNDDLW